MQLVKFNGSVLAQIKAPSESHSFVAFKPLDFDIQHYKKLLEQVKLPIPYSIYFLSEPVSLINSKATANFKIYCIQTNNSQLCLLQPKSNLCSSQHLAICIKKIEANQARS